MVSIDQSSRFVATHTYLTVCSMYHEAYASKTLTVCERVSQLAAVVFFFRGWNRWLDRSAKWCRKRNGISYEACTDLEINVGCFVTVYAILADHNKFVHPLHPVNPEQFVRICIPVTVTVR